MEWLRQSTVVEVLVGPFIDATDFKTPETGLTLLFNDCLLSKNAGAFGFKNDENSATHLSGGCYKIALDATDTNTPGRLRAQIQKAGSLPVWKEWIVVPANVYDSLILGTDLLDGNVAQWRGTAPASPATAGIPSVAVIGDVPGKVLGGGSSDITGVGARVVDADGEPVAKQSTLNAVGMIVTTIVSQTNSIVSTLATLAASTATAVWAAVTRTLTAGTKDDEIDAIQAAVEAITSGDVVNLTVLPLSSTVSSGKVISDDVTVYQHARYRLQFGITDEENVPKDVTGKTLVFYVFDPADLSIAWQLSGSDIVISGDDGNQVAVSGSEATTVLARSLAYVLRNLTDKEVLATGAFTVEPLPAATVP